MFTAPSWGPAAPCAQPAAGGGGPCLAVGPIGGGRQAFVAGPGLPRVDGVQTVSSCHRAQCMPPPWVCLCWPRGAPLPELKLEVSPRTGQVGAGWLVPMLWLRGAMWPHDSPGWGRLPQCSGFPVRGTRCRSLALSVVLPLGVRSLPVGTGHPSSVPWVMPLNATLLLDPLPVPQLWPHRGHLLSPMTSTGP